MNTTCAYCDAGLGTNSLLAEYPVGRTLAYDAARELLWSVCPKCRAWNLSYLDAVERKQAIARLEEQYSSGVARYEKPPIGIARLGAPGTIYKVGASGWRQFAAWRYGERMVRQRWVWLGRIAIALALAALVWSDTVDRLLDNDWVLGAFMLGIGAVLYRAHRGILFRGTDVTGRAVEVRSGEVTAAKIAGHRDDWTLTVGSSEPKIFSGRNAVMLLSRILRQRNSAGASRRQVTKALDLIDRLGGPHELLGGFLRAAASGDSFGVQDLSAVQKIALEMATQEDAERRALAARVGQISATAREARERAALVDGVLN